MSKPEIVVGIDFGTTYSGFSWATKTKLKKINLVTNWKTTDQDFSPTNDKVRTWISYKNSSASSFGYEATGTPFKWFKILLQPGQYNGDLQYVREANANLTKLGKPVDEIISEYLRWVWKTGMEDIREHQGSDFESIYSFKVVLTVPAAWEPIAKERTLRAARNAGLPSNIKLVSEPEAGALLALVEKSENDELKIGDVFVVCDAGGGTVDLISYEVTQLHPLRLRECAVGEGDLCGSVFLDLGFEQLIKRKVGEKKYESIRERDKKKMMSHFEYRIKRHFDGDLTKDTSVVLPGLGAPADDSDEEDDDLVYLRGSEILSVFDPVCKKIDRMVDSQISQIKRSGKRVNAILLIGGFGDSSYLHSRLEKTYKGQGINVLKTPKAWSAVCRGATAWGLDESTFVSFIARESYGQCFSVPFDASIHDFKDRVWDDSEDIWRADNQMGWLIRRGDDLKVGSILTHGIYVSVRESTLRLRGTYTFTLRLWYNKDGRPPRRREDNVTEVCVVAFDLESAKILQKTEPRKSPGDDSMWHDVSFMMKLELHNTNMTFSASFAGETVGIVRADYIDASQMQT